MAHPHRRLGRLRSLAKAIHERERGPQTRTPAWFFSLLPNRIGSGATISLTPIFLTEVLGGTVADVGIASALTSAASVPSATLWGWLSDRVGRRKHYLVLGFLGFGLPTLLMGLSTSIWQFFALSLLVGMLSVAGTPVSSTLIMDTTDKDEWETAFGRYNQVSGWGMVAGRIVGLVCITYGIALIGNEAAQRGLWLLGGGLSMLSVVWAWAAVPELGMPKPRPPRRHEPSLIRYTGYALVERVRFLPMSLYHLPHWNPLRALQQIYGSAHTGLERLPGQMRRGSRQGLAFVREPLIAFYLASFFLFTMSTMAYTPFAVWQRQELDNSTAMVFLVGLVNSIAATLSYRWIGKLAKSKGSLRVQIVTISLRIGVFGGFAVMTVLGWYGTWGLVLLLALQAISGISWAGIAVAGNSTVAHLAPLSKEGAAMGVYTSFTSIGAIIGAFISGYVVLTVGYAIVFAAGAAGVGLSVLILWLLRRNAPPEALTHL